MYKGGAGTMGHFQVLFKFILIYLKEKSTNTHQNAFKCATRVLTLGSQRVQLRRLLLSVCRTLIRDLLNFCFYKKWRAQWVTLDFVF